MLVAGLIGLHFALQQTLGPFHPERSVPRYAPDRTFDLQHVKVEIQVDYPRREFTGRAVSTFKPLRDGLTEVVLHAGEELQISSVTLDGRPATFRRAKEDLVLQGSAWTVGQTYTVEIKYRSTNQQGGGFGDEGGFHWIESDGDPDRIGFWTQGETTYNRRWAPTWDYPNDFATSETITTVPKGWTVVGNGKLVSEKSSGAQTTWHWKMDQPHATYLISLVGGPLSVKKDKWRGKDLWYVVPKGREHLIENSFDDTKAMLDCFSEHFGEYPYVKYAQNAMYDFGGGMENISASTLGAGSLSDAREGYRRMAGLNAHELMHQWFGDLVSCYDWGETWLNEGFATYGEAVYAGAAHGQAAYDLEIADNFNSYIGASRRYIRPMATKHRPNDDIMFDSHAYPKGSAILHTLRREIGDEAFFRGVRTYLDRHRHQPVTTSQLWRAMTDGSGINVEPFFDQWIARPGHPVIEYSWTPSPAGGVMVTVQQRQKTDLGVPIYRFKTRISVLSGGRVTDFPVVLNQATQSFQIPFSGSVDAVIFDGHRDFLAETQHEFGANELAAIVRSAPNASHRAQAFDQLLDGTISDATVALLAELIRADSGPITVFRDLEALVNLKRPDLLSLWRDQLGHPNPERQAWAARGIAALEPSPVTEALLLQAVERNTSFAAMQVGLDGLDAKKHEGLFRQQILADDHRERVGAFALRKWAATEPADLASIVEALATGESLAKRRMAYDYIEAATHRPWMAPLIASGLRSQDWSVVVSCLGAVLGGRLTDFLPQVKGLNLSGAPREVQQRRQRVLERLGS